MRLPSDRVTCHHPGHLFTRVIKGRRHTEVVSMRGDGYRPKECDGPHIEEFTIC